MRAYVVYDVFTGEALAGNPLAVVFDAEGLDTERMQAITRELNLSETVFVFPPQHPAAAASIRIFTPGRELPFAGHPTVGTAIALARARGLSGSLVLEEKIGPVTCRVSLPEGGAGFADFDLPRQSGELDLPLDAADLARALGLEPGDIGFDNHQPAAFSAGVPFVTLPVTNREAVSRIRFQAEKWQAAAPVVDGNSVSVYAYSRSDSDFADFHCRMFSPSMGIAEDPATGAAAAALSGAILKGDGLEDGLHQIALQQGVEMGRPSLIHMTLTIDNGSITAATIGGEAVLVARGELAL